MTAILFRNAPLLGTFHAAGESAAYRYLTPAVAVAGGTARPALRRLRGGARDGPRGPRRRVPVAVQRHRDRAVRESRRRGPTDGPTVFFVGRHEPRKGLGVLLAALQYLPADVRLWIGGDGAQTEALRAEHTGDPRIEWLGRIDDSEKASCMRGADVFCAPSLRGESFGVVLLEAMAAQTPVVASDLDGYRNVARSGADALLVPPGDPRALAAAINEVLANRACADALVTSGQQRAEQFSMDNLAQQYIELYRQL